MSSKVCLPNEVLAAINEAMGGNEWQGDASVGELGPLAADAICHLATRRALPESLHTFLDAAAGEGLVLNGIDAGDLYVAIFPERYEMALRRAEI